MIDKNRIIERLTERKKGKKDNYKIGMIIEGGGMRGTFAGGVMTALEKFGLTDCFDVIYASSSGSCAAVYFLSKKAKEGTAIYYDELSGKNFINPLRFSKIMDLDLVFDDLLPNTKKVDQEKLTDSKTLLKIFVSEAETGRPICFTNRDDENIYKIMKASCALPGFYNNPVNVMGSKSLDGNVAKKMPIEEAITDGCTDVLVVTTVPEWYREPSFRLLGFIRKILMVTLHRNFKNAYKKRRETYNSALDVVFGKEVVHREINICHISPDYKVSEGESKKDRLIEFANHGIMKTREFFGL